MIKNPENGQIVLRTEATTYELPDHSRVWVVTEGMYSDYGIEAIFSSEEKAKAFVAKHEYNEDRQVIEWTIDEWLDAGDRTVWRYVIIVDTGEFHGKCIVNEKFVTNARYTKTFTSRGWNGKENFATIVAESAVSEDHCRKIAVEARQAALRKESMP